MPLCNKPRLNSLLKNTLSKALATLALTLPQKKLVRYVMEHSILSDSFHSQQTAFFNRLLNLDRLIASRVDAIVAHSSTCAEQY